MPGTKAVIEGAGVYRISELFKRKPPILRFNETDAVVVTARTEDGKRVNSTFYLCLKPDGTFDEETMGVDAAQARRHKLAAFLRYYKIAEDVGSYNLKERVGEWKGRAVEVLTGEKGAVIYVP
jgi:hypothetical protein